MKKNKDWEKEKELAYMSHQSPDDFEAKPINWKKTSIILSIIAAIITGAVLLWLFVFKGKDYIDYKDIARNTYNQLFVDDSFNKDSKYINDDLKVSSKEFTLSLKEIYSKGGFTYTSESNDKLTGYKYSKKRELEIININSSDYVFGFVDKGLEKYIPKDPKNHFPKYLSNRITLRIRNGKIAAIGFRYDSDDNTNGGYRWLKGSYTKGMVGR